MLHPLADMITPLMTASFVYLFLLNAVIGILEGTLLRRWFGGSRRSLGWMIAGNYLSAWIGLLALVYFLSPHFKTLLGAKPIERINLLVAGIVLVSFAMTVLLEFAFVHAARKPPQKLRGRSLLGSLLATICVNAISYVPICLWFLYMCFTLPLNARIRSLSEMGQLPAGTLYWVDPSGRVMCRSLAANDPARSVGQVDLNEYIFPYQLRIERAENPSRARLTAFFASHVFNSESDPQQPIEVVPAGAFPPDYWEQSRILRRTVLDDRPLAARQTQVNFDWYRQTLKTACPQGPDSRLYVALPTLFWQIAEPTILPDDKIVFQWSGQIVLFDPHSQNLAFIALGTCPAFVPARPSNQAVR